MLLYANGSAICFVLGRRKSIVLHLYNHNNFLFILFANDSDNGPILKLLIFLPIHRIMVNNADEFALKLNCHHHKILWFIHIVVSVSKIYTNTKWAIFDINHYTYLYIRKTKCLAYFSCKRMDIVKFKFWVDPH